MDRGAQLKGRRGDEVMDRNEIKVNKKSPPVLPGRP